MDSKKWLTVLLEFLTNRNKGIYRYKHDGDMPEGKCRSWSCMMTACL